MAGLVAGLRCRLVVVGVSGELKNDRQQERSDAKAKLMLVDKVRPWDRMVETTQMVILGMCIARLNGQPFLGRIRQSVV